MTKMLIGRVVPAVAGIAITVVACLWLYGFAGVRFGWIGATDYPGLNAVSHHGGECAGGLPRLLKAKAGF